LADDDETRHILIKHLETTAVFLRLAGVAETTGAVQHALECLEVDCTGKSQ
jgi:D-alanine-D-alanine ligase-like ATP-grasp enzyme